MQVAVLPQPVKHYFPSSTLFYSFGMHRVLAAPVNKASSSFPASLLSSKAASESFLDLSLESISHYWLLHQGAKTYFLSLIAFMKSSQLSQVVILSYLFLTALANISSWIYTNKLATESPIVSSTFNCCFTPSFLLQHLVSPFSRSLEPTSSLIGTPLCSQ